MASSLLTALNQRVAFGGKNALTAIERSGGANTEYLQANQGYGKIVGVQFNGKGKVYDYIDLNGTQRVGDHPTVEVTNSVTGKNSFVPGKHTEIVRAVKGGIEKNLELLDKATNKGINLKTIQTQGELKTNYRLFPGMSMDDLKATKKLVGED